MKPGIKTTEFWATILTHIIAALTLLHPGFKTPAWAQTFAPLASAITTAVYAIGRSSIKKAAAITIDPTAPLRLLTTAAGNNTVDALRNVLNALHTPPTTTPLRMTPPDIPGAP